MREETVRFLLFCVTSVYFESILDLKGHLRLDCPLEARLFDFDAIAARRQIRKEVIARVVGQVEGGLSPRTCEKYALYCKQVVASKKAPNGEDMYPRQWNAEVMDLPVVVHSKQKRPAQKVDGVNMLIASAESDEERYLYVLLAATGMRISEALALEAKHFINGGRTIVVEQQVMKDCPRIKKKLKTDASYRQIDLHPNVADYLRKFVTGRCGLILQTKNDTPYL
jgi:integrase